MHAINVEEEWLIQARTRIKTPGKMNIRSERAKHVRDDNSVSPGPVAESSSLQGRKAGHSPSAGTAMRPR